MNDESFNNGFVKQAEKLGFTTVQATELLKQAFNLGQVGEFIQNKGQQLGNFVKENPTTSGAVAGSVLGAGTGAVANPNNRLKGALAGGVLGAGTGALGGNILGQQAAKPNAGFLSGLGAKYSPESVLNQSRDELITNLQGEVNSLRGRLGDAANNYTDDELVRFLMPHMGGGQ